MGVKTPIVNYFFILLNASFKKFWDIRSALISYIRLERKLVD